jgi:hypothetical protein
MRFLPNKANKCFVLKPCIPDDRRTFRFVSQIQGGDHRQAATTTNKQRISKLRTDLFGAV